VANAKTLYENISLPMVSVTNLSRPLITWQSIS
jgi:hypothetical protein